METAQTHIFTSGVCACVRACVRARVCVNDVVLLRAYLHPRARGRLCDLQGALPVGPALTVTALQQSRGSIPLLPAPASPVPGSCSRARQGQVRACVCVRACRRVCVRVCSVALIVTSATQQCVPEFECEYSSNQNNPCVSVRLHSSL
jgi:hypothetical protein